MIIKTNNINNLTQLEKIVGKLILPKTDSHKGQNGRLLVIGGSSLFHSALLWAAEISSHFVDIVHYCSTKENEKIFINLKTKFRNGIVISKKDLLDYVKEDDAILIGTGMIRNSKVKSQKSKVEKIQDILNIDDEGDYTYFLTKFLIENFPEKRFVFDAGSLQMMEKEWFLNLKKTPIITPHQKEFEKLFAEKIINLDFKEKIRLVEKMAKKYKVVILLKAIKDIISDGKTTYVIEGGNQGLTKGGTGDLLAGLTASFYCKNNPVVSAVFSSFLLKKTSDKLYEKFKYWYNIDDILKTIPEILAQLL